MPAHATARGHRAMAPAGAGGRGVPLTYRAMAPAGAGGRGSRPTANC